MAYTQEQVEKYNLKPEQLGTFIPKISPLEQQIIDRFVGKKEPVLLRRNEPLFRQQIMAEQTTEATLLPVKEKAVPQALNLLTAFGIIR